jgi:hypothetical protein
MELFASELSMALGSIEATVVSSSGVSSLVGKNSGMKVGHGWIWVCRCMQWCCDGGDAGGAFW